MLDPNRDKSAGRDPRGELTQWGGDNSLDSFSAASAKSHFGRLDHLLKDLGKLLRDPVGVIGDHDMRSSRVAFESRLIDFAQIYETLAGVEAGKIGFLVDHSPALRQIVVDGAINLLGKPDLHRYAEGLLRSGLVTKALLKEKSVASAAVDGLSARVESMLDDHLAEIKTQINRIAHTTDRSTPGKVADLDCYGELRRFFRSERFFIAVVNGSKRLLQEASEVQSDTALATILGLLSKVGEGRYLEFRKPQVRRRYLDMIDSELQSYCLATAQSPKGSEETKFFKLKRDHLGLFSPLEARMQALVSGILDRSAAPMLSRSSAEQLRDLLISLSRREISGRMSQALEYLLPEIEGDSIRDSDNNSILHLELRGSLVVAIRQKCSSIQ